MDSCPGSVVPLAMFSTICHQMVPLALVKFLATRWRHLHWLQMWSLFSTIGHQMVPLALVKILATRWRHLHWLQMWSPGGTTCISCKFYQLGEAPCISCKSGHQVAPLALVQNLVFRWRHFDCVQCWPPGCITCIATLPWIALLALSVSIELMSSSARVTSVKSQKGHSLTQFQTSGVRIPDP